MRLRLVTYNILDGGAGREEWIARILQEQRADLIVLQEVTDEAFAQQLATRFEMNAFVARGSSGRHPALLSRFSIRKANSFQPSPLRHPLLEATVEYAPGETVTIFGAHLAASAFDLRVEWWRTREVRKILERVAQLKPVRAILAGDMNALAPGDPVAMQTLSGGMRWSIRLHGGLVWRRTIAMLTAAGWADCFRRLHPTEQGYTLPASAPFTRLDYIFVNGALEKSLRECRVVTSPEIVRRASDHLPVMAEWQLDG